MAFHNDCFYLALQLLTLGMQYQDRYARNHRTRRTRSTRRAHTQYLLTRPHICVQHRLPKDKGAFTLVDLVPVFRQLGEKQYQQQVVQEPSTQTRTQKSIACFC
jgi:hypothetical protein